MTVNRFARGLRYGQLLTELDKARAALSRAIGQGSLLPEEDRRRLAEAWQAIGDLEQKAWVLAGVEQKGRSKP